MISVINNLSTNKLESNLLYAEKPDFMYIEKQKNCDENKKCPMNYKPVCDQYGGNYGNKCIFSNAQCKQPDLIETKCSAGIGAPPRPPPLRPPPPRRTKSPPLRPTPRRTKPPARTAAVGKAICELTTDEDCKDPNECIHYTCSSDEQAKRMLENISIDCPIDKIKQCDVKDKRVYCGCVKMITGTAFPAGNPAKNIDKCPSGTREVTETAYTTCYNPVALLLKEKHLRAACPPKAWPPIEIRSCAIINSNRPGGPGL